MNEVDPKVALVNGLLTAAVQNALTNRLVALGVLGSADLKEIKEEALLILEKLHGGASPELQAAAAVARAQLEGYLRPADRTPKRED